MIDSELIHTLGEIKSGAGDADIDSLYYHERLMRKDQMEAILFQVDEPLKKLQSLAEEPQSRATEDGGIIIWTVNTLEMDKILPLSEELEKYTSELDALFRDLGTLALAYLDDRIKMIVREANGEQRDTSILHSWDKLEHELVDDDIVHVEDVRGHRDAIVSLLNILIENQESAFAKSETQGGSVKSRINSISSPFEKLNLAKSQGTASKSGHSKSSSSGSQPGETPWNEGGLSNKPKRASILFVDWNNIG
jgi:hypothetical protein